MATPPISLNQMHSAYSQFFQTGGTLMEQGRLAVHTTRAFVCKQYDLLKQNDALLFPVLLVASAVALLCLNTFGTLLFFSIGTLYGVAKGNRSWRDGIRPLTELWNGSQVGKIVLIAALIFIVAPQSCNIAAFAMGMFVVHLLNESPV